MDERLQRLRRNLTPDTFDAYLLELLRTGNLTPLQLEQLAYLGEPVVVSALPDGDDDPTTDLPLQLDPDLVETLLHLRNPHDDGEFHDEPIRGWARKLTDFGKPFCLRALVALAHHALRRWEQDPLDGGFPCEPGDPRVRRAIERTDRYLVDPDQHVPQGDYSTDLPRWAFVPAHHASSGMASDMFTDSIADAVVYAARLLDTNLPATAALIRPELTPWIVGTHDPVAQRVQARGPLTDLADFDP